ncbi:MAG TPA: hypothetical protein VNN80_32675, partial [Polyangiaceae bacterium]|nr:hypothetical protein [Polyangiaceae bacterium]
LAAFVQLASYRASSTNFSHDSAAFVPALTASLDPGSLDPAGAGSAGAAAAAGGSAAAGSLAAGALAVLPPHASKLDNTTA